MVARISCSACLVALLASAAPAQQYEPGDEGTFSIIGRDPATGQLGIAVHSKTIAVGSRVRGGKGGVAVFAHQSASNPMYSTLGVELLEAGMTPQQALDMMLRGDEGRNSRQVAILDAQGRTAAFTSPTITDWKGHKCGVNYCAQGNTLTGPEVVDAMARSFEASSGPLAERLLDALEAGQAQGGDRRGVQSASLMILKPLAIQGFGDRELDLRVDEHRTPFAELRRILNAVRSGEILSEANARLSAKDLKGALEKATAAREKSPTNDNAWVALANIHLQMGQKTEALSALGRAVELNPANKKQLLRNSAFETLYMDPAFLKIVGGS
ncbi:MAG TPA: DUF1028 domain-containing protein [Vicinamibacterales bacterium]|jgi:uncharacterized Ntn-hydrolase superfamily protein|nr:DUF1028 domain-containing protein [Vicinamibacterales bacterium]